MRKLLTSNEVVLRSLELLCTERLGLLALVFEVVDEAKDVGSCILQLLPGGKSLRVDD